MSLTVAELRALFTADTKDIDRAQDRIRKDTHKTQGVLKTAAGTMTGFLGANIATGAVRGIAGLIKTSSQLSAEYGKNMAMMKAATGATAGEIDKLDALATKLGADTQFSAGEAAAAMLDLGKAGVKTKDIIGGGLKSTLLLATAGTTDLGTASTIAANAMAAFGLEGRDMERIAVALAGGANASTASVESLGQALQQVGPGAKNAGLSLNETVAVLSAFDKAGIKGSDSGTSLKTMLVNLVPQTDAAKAAMDRLDLSFVNADGSFKSITEIAGLLQAKLGPLSEAQRTVALSTIFGSDASRAASVLMKEGAKGIAGFIKATKDQTAAEKMAAAATSGAGGALERLRGAVETGQKKIGDALNPTIEKTSNLLSTDVVPAVTDFITGMQDGTGAGGDFADMLGDVKDIGEGVFRVIDSLPGPVKKYGAELAIATLAMSKLGAMSGGMIPTIARTKQLYAEMTYTETRMAAVSKTAHAFGGALRNVAGAGGLIAVQQGMSQTNKATGALLTTLGGVATGFAIGGPIGGAVGGLAGAFLSLKTNTRDAGEAARDSIGDWESYVDTLDGVTGAVTEATRALVKKRLEASGALKVTRELGISDNQVVDSIADGGKGGRNLIAALNAEKAALDAVIKAKNAAGTNSLRERQELMVLEKKTKARKAEIDAIIAAIGAIEDSIEKKREEIHATNDYDKLLKGLPKGVTTKVQALDTLPTIRQVRDLAKAYKLTPKEVRTLVKAIDADKTKKQLDELIERWFDGQNLKPLKPKVNTSSVDSALSKLLKLYATWKNPPKGSGLGGGGNSTDSSGLFPNMNPRTAQPGVAPRFTESPLAGGITPRTATLARGSVGRTAAVTITPTPKTTSVGGGRVGSTLEILEARRTIRDLQKDLRSWNSGKKAFNLTGLDRQIAKAQLAEARKDLAKLVGKKATQDALDAYKAQMEAVQEAFATKSSGIADALKSSQGIFSTGTTSANQLLKNLQTDSVTNNQWASLLAGLAKAGVSKSIIDQFIANGPSSQALKLGQSILSTGNISALNTAAGTLGSQAIALGNAGAAYDQSGNAGALVAIENFNSYGMTPDEVAQRIYYQSQVVR